MFSHSRLLTFEQCGLRYKFRYIDKLETEVERSVEAFLGSMVHETLEKLYKDLMFQKLNTEEEILEWYNERWRKMWNDGILIVRNEYGPENYRMMGERFIRDYYRRYHPFDRPRTIGLEIPVKIRLDNEGRYLMRGYIDRLAYAGNGVYEIHDYKTNGSLPVNEYLEKDRQLALYAIAVKQNYSDAKRVKLVWHFLAHDKEIVMEKSDEQLEKLRKETIELIDRINSAKEFRPRESAICDWCEFRSHCPLWSHISRVENLEPNEYLNDPGVKLVNRYAELVVKKKELTDEIEKVREAIVKFSDRTGSSVIAGSDVVVKVWKGERIKLPGKNESERVAVEEILRDAGLLEEFSTIDAYGLSRAISSGMVPEDVVKRLERFVSRERIERLYLRDVQKEE